MSLQTGSPSSVWGFIRWTGQTLGVQTSACGGKTKSWRAPGLLARGHPEPPQHLLPPFLQPPINKESGHEPCALNPAAASSSSSPVVTPQPWGLGVLGLKKRVTPPAYLSWRAPRAPRLAALLLALRH